MVLFLPQTNFLEAESNLSELEVESNVIDSGKVIFKPYDFHNYIYLPPCKSARLCKVLWCLHRHIS